MRKEFLLLCVTMAILAGLLVSCASLDPAAPTAVSPRFHETDRANLMLIYYGEENIFMTKPDTRENGFLPLLSKQDIEHFLTRPEIGRDLAVIIVSHTSYDRQSALMADWQGRLAGSGFQRVVFLEAGQKDQADGLLILRDSAIANADAAPAIRPNTLAALTPAP